MRLGTKVLTQNLEEVNKELKMAHKKREEEKKRENDARKQTNPNEKRNARIEKLKLENSSISSKTRNTVQIFREIKTFLKTFLPKIAPAANEGIIRLLRKESTGQTIYIEAVLIYNRN